MARPTDLPKPREKYPPAPVSGVRRCRTEERRAKVTMVPTTKQRSGTDDRDVTTETAPPFRRWMPLLGC